MATNLKPSSPRKQKESLAEYIDNLQSRGRYTLIKSEALKSLAISPVAFQRAAHRLIRKRRLFSPRQGFFVIVPIEYRTTGTPPPTWFIDSLMAFHRQPYYVGLLSAAALHGAAHQQPMEFQVITAKPLRPIKFEQVRIRFFVKRSFEQTATSSVKTPTGKMQVSSPETTAFDLFRYYHDVGNLNQIATVLQELSEVMKPEALLQSAQKGIEFSIIQRLGYVLELLGKKTLTGPLYRWLKSQNPQFIPLDPNARTRESPRDKKWNIMINQTIEADL